LIVRSEAFYLCLVVARPPFLLTFPIFLEMAVSYSAFLVSPKQLGNNIHTCLLVSTAPMLQVAASHGYTFGHIVTQAPTISIKFHWLHTKQRHEAPPQQWCVRGLAKM
jgi:hypothetical protein